jgi:hypothetical protein
MHTNVRIQTVQVHWLSLGTIDATAAGNDSALGVTERTFQSVKDLDNVVWWKASPGMNAMIARFLLATNDADVDIDVWVGRMNGDPYKDSTLDVGLQRLCTLDVICGQQTDVVATKLYADTINVSNDVARHEIFSSSMTSSIEDHMANMAVDLGGVNIVVFHGYGTFDEDCEVQISGY